jgi:hypothetical protein
MDGHSAIRTFASIFLWSFLSIYVMRSGYIPIAFFIGIYRRKGMPRRGCRMGQRVGPL